MKGLIDNNNFNLKEYCCAIWDNLQYNILYSISKKNWVKVHAQIQMNT